MASYVVKPGDTLAVIARRNNTTVDNLLALNPKLATDPKYSGGKVIFSGTNIKLPAPAVTNKPAAQSTAVATNAPIVNTDPASLALQKLTSGQTLTAEERALLNLAPAGTQDQAPAGTQDQAPAGTQDEAPAPTQEVKPELAVGSSDLQTYLLAQEKKTADLAKAQAANALSLREAQAAYEPAIRQSERNMYGAELKALSTLASRGFTGPTGLSAAAVRSAQYAPLQTRIEALNKLAAAQRSANVLMAEQIAKAEQENQAALAPITKATTIANKLGGR